MTLVPQTFSSTTQYRCCNWKNSVSVSTIDKTETKDGKCDKDIKNRCNIGVIAFVPGFRRTIESRSLLLFHGKHDSQSPPTCTACYEVLIEKKWKLSRRMILIGTGKYNNLYALLMSFNSNFSWSVKLTKFIANIWGLSFFKRSIIFNFFDFNLLLYVI